jgi:hypothetical protein
LIYSNPQEIYMAMNDGLKTPHRDGVADPRKGMDMLPVILGVLVALALGWWFFGDRLMPSDTRTSTPVTGTPTSGSPSNTNTSNPSTSKQP